MLLIFSPFGHPTGVQFIFLTNGPWDAQVELQSANDFSYRFYYTFFQENLQKTLLKINEAKILLNSQSKF